METVSPAATRAFTVPTLLRAGLRHVFGTRDPWLAPGVGRVTAITDEGTGRGAVAVAVTQVHGTDVLVLDTSVSSGLEFRGGWDALVTNQWGVWLAVRTADCVPVLVDAPDHGVIAAIHAGWRGTVAGILRGTLTAIQARFGVSPGQLRVGIGPSAGPCCYEVDAQVLDGVRRYADWESAVRPAGSAKAYLDLARLIELQATQLGIPADGVDRLGLCTICDPGRFYSYRRDGRVIGTMVSGIVMDAADRL